MVISNHNGYGEKSRRLIYVQGEVIQPGKYEFIEEPNVWEAIREAGGATCNTENNN